MDDVIVISDDEDVQYIKYVVNLEPVTIDLTKNESPRQEQRAKPEQDTEAKSSTTKPAESEPERSEQSEFRPPEPGPARNEPSRFETSEPEPAENQFSKPATNFEQSNAQPTQPEPARPEPSRPETSKAETSRPETSRPIPAQAGPAEPAPVQSEPTKPTKPENPPMTDRELMMVQKTLGNEKYRHNLFDDAIRIYKRANQLAKQLEDKEMSAILHFNLAMTYYKLGSLDQAADECANAVKINDNYMKAHLKRAEIYLRQCKYEEAVICYEHICNLDGSNRDYAILLKQARDRAKLTKKKDYYKILGLSTNFTMEDLKKAYRHKALSHHPDRHSDADIVTRKIEEKRFKEASEAHSFIQLKFGYTR